MLARALQRGREEEAVAGLHIPECLPRLREASARLMTLQSQHTQRVRTPTTDAAHSMMHALCVGPSERSATNSTGNYTGLPSIYIIEPGALGPHAPSYPQLGI